MHTLSKLVISVVMLRGRHRGLPVALDRAVLMPSEFLTTRSAVTGVAAPPALLDEERGANEDEKSDGNADSPGRGNEVPHVQIQQDNLNSNSKDEVAARLRLRTRTISLQIPDLGHGGYVSETRTEVSTSPPSLAEGVSDSDSEDGGHATSTVPHSDAGSEDSAHS